MFLKRLDDAIDLKERIIFTLESMARTIFTSWFIDFDPIRAKAEGRKPYGMDDETAALFPDSFEESEVGKIPKGWTVIYLGEVIEIFDSERIPLSDMERSSRQGTYPYYGAASVMKLYRWISIRWNIRVDGGGRFCYWRKRLAGSSICMGPILGQQSCPRPKREERIGNENSYGVPQTNEYQTIRHRGSATKLNQGNLKRIPFLKPPNEVLSRFQQIMDSLYSLIRNNSEENVTLSTLRDILLPKILSGEIRIKELVES